MSEPIGLIERAAALLRDRAAEVAVVPTPIADVGRDKPDIVLDPVRLAHYGIALPTERRSRSVEEFRLIKRNLMTGWSQNGHATERQSRSIVVTSARPGEGKTFVALNLAMGFAAEAEGEALLLDADTEHPMLAMLCDAPLDKGLVDVLAGELELPDVALRTSLPRLTIVPSGKGGPHVPELFSGRSMAKLLGELTGRSGGRITLIDTPPCLVTSEAATMAPLVDQIILVVEAHRTHQSEIESCLTLLSGCQNVSLLLNKSDAAPSDYFGKYGYYYAFGKKDRSRNNVDAVGRS